jgi:hypothetical protein
MSVSQSEHDASLNLTGENSSEAMAQIAFGLECQE